MSEEAKKKATKSSTLEPTTSKKTEDTIIIGGKPRKILKMKAGKYFECQKLFLKMVNDVHRLHTEMTQLEGKTAEEKKKAGLKEVTYWDIMTVVPDDMLEFLAACLDVPVDFLKTEASPEEIPMAYAKVVSLNDFMGNIKNFVAPIRESLGV